MVRYRWVEDMHQQTSQLLFHFFELFSSLFFPHHFSTYVYLLLFPYFFKLMIRISLQYSFVSMVVYVVIDIEAPE